MAPPHGAAPPRGGEAAAPPRAPREPVDLGFEPPLGVGDRRRSPGDRRAVSLRWLSATVLAGLAGAGLMGLAVVQSTDRGAAAPTRPQFAAARAPERTGPGARKGDKLVRAVDSIAAKRSFRAPATVRVGDREAIRVRAYVRVASPLALVGGAYADEIPPFDPVKLLTGAGDRGFEAAPAPADAPDAEASLVTRDLAATAAALAARGAGFAGAALGDEDALAQVREAVATARRRSVALPPQLLLARAMRAPEAAGALAYAPTGGGPFTGIDVRMVPENVTVVPKVDPAQAPPAGEERLVTLRRGEGLEAALRAAGAGEAARPAAAALATSARSAERAGVEGQRLKLLFQPPENGRRALARAALYEEAVLIGVAAVDDRNVFVPVAPPEAAPAATGAEEDEEGGMRLYDSLYETALKNEVPRPVIDNLVRVLSADTDTDFQRRSQGGDAFELLYEGEEEGGTGDVLYASLTAGGEVKRYFRFQAPDDGTVDYYDERGRSAKKFLMRKPLAEGSISSGFGFRRHPILGYSKMHTGVDWRNRVGTPILAAGNGAVILAEWSGGYGRRVEVQHANGYVTSYNHLSGFARGVQPGFKVRQGQVIGYLGSTGLSTGPHLHYEVMVNDRFVDPMRIKVPRGRELDGALLAEFRRERERIEALMRRGPGQAALADRAPG